MKAIKITVENRSMLAGRFGREDTNELPVGYWLVTDFGNDETFETVTPARFAALFTVGETLKNDFVDIERK